MSSASPEERAAFETLQRLTARAQIEGWSDALDRDLEDFEIYLGIELERLEDTDPALLRADPERAARLEQLLSVAADLREMKGKQ